MYIYISPMNVAPSMGGKVKITKMILGLVLCLVLVSGSLLAAPQCTKKCDKVCALKAKPATDAKKATMTAKQLMENMKSHKYNGDPIKLHLKDADLANVLAMFTKVSGLKFTVETGVEGAITINQDKVPWDKLLHHLLEEHKLTLAEKDNGLVVGKPAAK